MAGLRVAGQSRPRRHARMPAVAAAPYSPPSPAVTTSACKAKPPRGTPLPPSGTAPEPAGGEQRGPPHRDALAEVGYGPAASTDTRDHPPRRSALAVARRPRDRKRRQPHRCTELAKPEVPRDAGEYPHGADCRGARGRRPTMSISGDAHPARDRAAPVRHSGTTCAGLTATSSPPPVPGGAGLQTECARSARPASRRPPQGANLPAAWHGVSGVRGNRAARPGRRVADVTLPVGRTPAWHATGLRGPGDAVKDVCSLD